MIAGMTSDQNCYCAPVTVLPQKVIFQVIQVIFTFIVCILCRMLLGIKWYHFISNDEVRRQTNQPLLMEIIQA